MSESKMAKAIKPEVVPTKLTATTTSNAPITLEQQLAAPVTIRTSRTVKLKNKKESDSTDETIEVHKFVTEPAVASVSIPLKMTKEFQSIGIEIGVSIPCYTEELDSGIEKAFEMAFERIAIKIPEIQKTLLEIAKSLK